MDHTLVASQSVTIHRPREVVWQVLTEPAYVKRYLYGADLHTDWSVGSQVLFQGEYAGQPWQDKGVVQVYDQSHRLEYTYYSGSIGLEDLPANYATIAYQLEAHPEGTLLTVRQQGFADEASRARSTENWKTILVEVKSLSETA